MPKRINKFLPTPLKLTSRLGYLIVIIGHSFSFLVFFTVFLFDVSTKQLHEQHYGYETPCIINSPPHTPLQSQVCVFKESRNCRLFHDPLSSVDSSALWCGFSALGNQIHQHTPVTSVPLGNCHRVHFLHLPFLPPFLFIPCSVFFYLLLHLWQILLFPSQMTKILVPSCCNLYSHLLSPILS